MDWSTILENMAMFRNWTLKPYTFQSHKSGEIWVEIK